MMQTVAVEDDQSTNLIVFGLVKEPDENMERVVDDVLIQLGEKPNV